MQGQELKDRTVQGIARECNKKTEGGRRRVFNLQKKMASFVINIVEEGVEMQRRELKRLRVGITYRESDYVEMVNPTKNKKAM